MHDPIPFTAPPLLSAATKRWIAEPLGLTTLPLHIHEVIGFFLLYHFICARLSPFLSGRLFPNTYPRLPWRTRLNWDVHVVSLFQSVIICALAFFVMAYDGERNAMSGVTKADAAGRPVLPRGVGAAGNEWRERIWGYTGATGLVQAAATGYFAWDLWVSALHMDVFGPGLLAHAVAALFVYSAGYRPFINYYAPSFVLYELSSPFLNVHWFCDKLDLTGSTLQFANGIVLILTFFGARLVWGVWQTVCVFYDVYRAVSWQHTRDGHGWLAGAGALRTAGFGAAAGSLRFVGLDKAVPTWLAVLYLSANVMLTCLNVFWFGKMISTIRARFPPPWGTRDVAAEQREEKLKRERDAKVLAGEQADGDNVMGRGVYEDGTKTVEVAAQGVKKRARRA